MKTNTKTAPADFGRAAYTSGYIKANADQAVLLGNPVIDNMMSAMIAMSAEMWAQTKRARIVEALLEEHGRVTEEMIESFVPSAAQEAKWTAERDRFIKRTFGAFAINGGPVTPFAQS
ncbi:MAG: hypothetical protein KDE14_06415 [Rhodobacteraceae bacterium]|nr:hypothetical protein [Paracoccaceae bacterium]